MKSKILIPIFVLAAGVYLAYFPKYPVGVYADDARYIAIGQSIQQGRYVDLSLFNEPTDNMYLPFYPAVLAVCLKILGSHWAGLRVISVMFTLLAGYLIWLIGRRVLPGKPAVLASAFFVLNPVTGMFAAAVLSEPCFIVLELGVWLLFLKVLDGDSRLRWGLSAALAALMLTRPIGFIAFIAIAAALAITKRLKQSTWLIAPLLFWGVWQVRNVLVSHQVSNYSSFWESGLSHYAAHPLALFDNLARMLYTVFVRTPLALTLPYNAPGIAAAIFVGGGVIAWVYLGIREWNRRGIRSAWGWSVGLFCVMYFAVLAGWPAVDVRYAWPLLPFILLGIFTVIASAPRGRWVIAGIAVLYIGSHAIQLQAYWKDPAGYSTGVPFETFRWMKAHLPPGTRVLYPDSSRLWLYTGFQGIPGYGAQNRDEFLAQLNRDGVGYTLFQSEKRLLVQGENRPTDQTVAFENNARWMTSWPQAFEPVYLNREEKTAVFALRKP